MAASRNKVSTLFFRVMFIFVVVESFVWRCLGMMSSLTTHASREHGKWFFNL